MYYSLLNHKINTQSIYNVYLDIKDSLSAYKVQKLKEILNIANMAEERWQKSILTKCVQLLILLWYLSD